MKTHLLEQRNLGLPPIFLPLIRRNSDVGAGRCGIWMGSVLGLIGTQWGRKMKTQWSRAHHFLPPLFLSYSRPELRPGHFILGERDDILFRSRSMAWASAKRMIDAPVEEVFNTVAHIEAFRNALPHIIDVEFLTDQQTGAGTRFRETRLMNGKRVCHRTGDHRVRTACAGADGDRHQRYGLGHAVHDRSPRRKHASGITDGCQGAQTDGQARQPLHPGTRPTRHRPRHGPGPEVLRRQRQPS